MSRHLPNRPAPPQPLFFAGGLPMRRAGQVVGSIGHSGGTGKQDQTVAGAGAAAL